MEAISGDDLANGLRAQQQMSCRLGEALLRLGLVSEEVLLDALAQQSGLTIVESGAVPDLAERCVDWLRSNSVNWRWFVERKVICWVQGDALAYCCRQPQLPSIEETLEKLTSGAHPLAPFFIRARDLERMCESVRASFESPASTRTTNLRELAEDAPTIEFVNRLIAQASDARASDVHVEPEAERCRIRFRIDGVLYERENLPIDRFDAIACRLKLIAGLDISERRLPQDGRFSTRISGAPVEFRVSVIPGIHGESIVLRLLPQRGAAETLEATGMSPQQQSHFEHWLRQPNGIVLVTGPTGSGKSTTLYAALGILNDGRRKIVTVEDPVERRIQGVTQIQTHAEIGVTFAAALRAILRHDPDVIMVGEIRDQETAQIATRAALTGHLVLATVHTNDAVSAVSRMVDIGVEPFLVASTLRGVIAQRLVRVLCADCSRPVTPESGRRVAGGGCPKCTGTGFAGRTAIYEMVSIPPQLQAELARIRSDEELRTMLRPHELCTLWSDGRDKVDRGITTDEELVRALGAGDEV